MKTNKKLVTSIICKNFVKQFVTVIFLIFITATKHYKDKTASPLITASKQKSQTHYNEETTYLVKEWAASLAALGIQLTDKLAQLDKILSMSMEIDLILQGHESGTARASCQILEYVSMNMASNAILEANDKAHLKASVST